MSLIEVFSEHIEAALSLREAEACERDLATFVMHVWNIIDPGNPLVWGRPMDAICDHLSAVDSGNIRRLLITVPPGFSKSTIANIAFPVWTWVHHPSHRFICASYGEGLTQRDNDRCRRIIGHEWFQGHWGDRWRLASPTRSELISNTRTGWKLATSVGGQLHGWRADTIILDDPNSPQVESDTVRVTTNRWFNEVVPDRLNNMVESSIIVIQQRMHLEDVAGAALAQTERGGVEWVHLNLPMEFEKRPYVNGYRLGSDQIESFYDGDVGECDEVFWQDWREYEGELAWPTRFPSAVVAAWKATLGPTMAAAKLQQTPVPRGGAIILRDWWQVWKEEAFPPMEYILASVDTAYTEKKQNDPSAMTVWGVNHDTLGNPRIFLLWAWQEWLQIHQLVEKIINCCTKDSRSVVGPRFPVHKVLIESAANGISVAHELWRLLADRSDKFSIELIDPKTYGDKVSRLYSVEPVFSQGIVYAHDRSWADKVINQCASVPHTSDDHLADSTAQAIRWLRERGFAPTKDEVSKENLAEQTYRPKLKSLYPC